jgi:hypothetical protein
VVREVSTIENRKLFFVYLNANTNSLYCALFTYAKWTFFVAGCVMAIFMQILSLRLYFFFISYTHILPCLNGFFKAYTREKFCFLFFFSYEFQNVNLLWLQQSPGKKHYQDLQHMQKRFFSVTSSVKFCMNANDIKGNFKLFLYLYEFHSLPSHK